MHRSACIYCAAVFTALLILSNTGSAKALTVINACVNKATGAVRIANACGRSETPLSWNQQGPAGSQGPAGPPGAQGPAGPQGSAGPGAVTVVDSTEKTLGPLVGSGRLVSGSNSNPIPLLTAAAVLLEIDSLWFALPVNSGGFLKAGVTFTYVTNDCSGTAYLQLPPIPDLFQTVSGNFNDSGRAPGVVLNLLYYAAPTTQLLQVGSTTMLNGDGTTGVCQQTSFQTYLSPIKTFDLSTLGFTPPFSLKVPGAP